MRCLVVTVLPPPDPARDRHGVYQRLGLFIQALASSGHQVDIVHFTDQNTIVDESTRLEREHVTSRNVSAVMGAAVTARLLPFNPARKRWWHNAHALAGVHYRRDFRPFTGAEAISQLRGMLQENYDFVFAHRLPAMAALAKTGIPDLPIFFDLDDVEHLVKQRAAVMSETTSARWRNKLEVPALARLEQRALRKAALTFLCSEHDLEKLTRDGFSMGRSVVAPNAVEGPTNQPALVNRPSVLFLGNYRHPPNADAAERLITRIWPRIREENPIAELLIAGAHPDRIRSFREQPEGVIFTGFVDNLEALYEHSRIVCCPIRNGGGTRLKLIEAALYGKPMVATHIAAEGLAFRHGRDIILRDDDARLAEACVQLLSTDAEATSQAANAFRLAKALYSPQRIRTQIAAAINSALHVDSITGDPVSRTPLLPHVLRKAGERITPEQLSLDEIRG
ncbi:MAG: glycosyltransferase [Beijerinckiaceae bacterium]